MRILAFVLSVSVLTAGAVAAHHRHRGAARKAHHQAHRKKTHAHHHSRHAASYASTQRENNQLLEMANIAKAELSEASMRLEEVLMDGALNGTAAALNGTATESPALRGGAKASSNVTAKRELSANVSAALKIQKGKLTDLFKHLKSNIADFNKRESEQKRDSQIYAERLKKRLEEEKKRLKDPKISDFDRELLTNRTKTEEHELKFWTHGRSLEHDMFHSNLKLTHGLMLHVKTVMEAYEQMLTKGKVDAKLTDALHQASSSLPKAFVQRESRIKKDVMKLNKHLKISARLLGRD
jgi:hypothetical protein